MKNHKIQNSPLSTAAALWMVGRIAGLMPANHVVAFVNVTTATLECVTVQGGEANDPSVNGSGGGIYIRCADESNRIFKTIVQCNEANHLGGGIVYSGLFFPANVEMEQCIVTRNFTTSGGGIALQGSMATPSIHETYIAGNNADFAGGGIYLDGAAPLLINDVISGNISLNGGGIAAFLGSEPLIFHCDINHNTGIETGGGIALRDGAGATIRSSIIYNNMPNGIEELDAPGDPLEVSFNLFRFNGVAEYLDFDTGPLFGAGAINVLMDTDSSLIGMVTQCL